MRIKSLDDLQKRVSDRNKDSIFQDYISREEIDDLINWSQNIQGINASRVHFVTKQEISEFPINTITSESGDATYFCTVKRNSGYAPISILWIGKKEESHTDYLIGVPGQRMITLTREYQENEEELSIRIFGQQVQGDIGNPSKDKYRDLTDKEINGIVMEIFNNTVEAMELFRNIRTKEYESQQEGELR